MQPYIWCDHGAAMQKLRIKRTGDRSHDKIGLPRDALFTAEDLRGASAHSLTAPRRFVPVWGVNGAATAAGEAWGFGVLQLYWISRAECDGHLPSQEADENKSTFNENDSKFIFTTCAYYRYVHILSGMVTTFTGKFLSFQKTATTPDFLNVCTIHVKSCQWG